MGKTMQLDKHTVTVPEDSATFKYLMSSFKSGKAIFSGWVHDSAVFKVDDKELEKVKLIAKNEGLNSEKRASEETVK